MANTDPEELAQELEHKADQLQQESERLGQEVADTRKEWEQKRSDPQVPGAAPPDSADS